MTTKMMTKIVSTARRILAYLCFPPYRKATQMCVTARTTFRPALKKNQDEVQTLAERLREVAGPNLTPDVDAALHVVEESAKADVHNVPFLDADAGLPTFSDKSTVYDSFDPNRCFATALVKATYSGKGRPDVTHVQDMKDAKHLTLVGLFSGSTNAFPNASLSENGVPCRTLNDTPWRLPRVHAGVPVTARFSVQPSVYGDLTAPDGYDPYPKTITIEASLHLFGSRV